MRTLKTIDAGAVLELDGRSLELEDVVAVARHRRPVAVAEAARRRIGRCREMVEVLLAEKEKVYGLTTGFGKLRDVVIPLEDTAKLQENLIMSHSCGVGRPFSEEVVRSALVLRANTLCRGNSGVRVAVVEQLVHMLNDGVYPYVPEKGSVGASGDLAPLSHLALVLIGHPEGRFMSRGRREAGADPGRPREQDFDFMPGPDELEATARREGWESFRPIELEAKEGLAVNNGTQVMTAVACLALYDGYHGLRTAELAGALSLEAQRGVLDAYDPRLHEVRPQAGQGEVAARVAAYCEGSQILSLYLNTGHLYQAREHLKKAAGFLAEIAGPEAADVREKARALAADLETVVPTGSESLAGGPREQISHFYRELRPLRERAGDLLRVVDGEAFPHTETAGKARAALVAAVKQLDDAVPETPWVQDDYSFRCFPQVLACAWRAWEHVAQIVAVEINSATDNPLLFPPDAGDDAMDPETYGAWLRADRARIEECKRGVLGGGNFHGEPIAQAMDYFAIAFAEVANVSERRVAHLVDTNLSRGLPPFLIASSGLNSGFMVPQYTAAALVSENKVLCHPASVDSVPTSANSEDHVSMGTHAARKAAEVLDNVLDVIAIELLTAYQGLEFRHPLEPGRRLRAVLALFAARGVERYGDDRVPYRDFQKLRRLMREQAFLDQLL